MNRTLRKIAARILTAAAFAMPMTAFAQTLPATPPAAAASAAPTLSPKQVYNATLKGTAWVVTANGWGNRWVVDRDQKIGYQPTTTSSTAWMPREVYFPVTVNGKLNTDPEHYRKNGQGDQGQSDRSRSEPRLGDSATRIDSRRSASAKKGRRQCGTG